MIVDSHCHLNYEVLSKNLDEVILKARENDVQFMLSICTKISEFQDILDIALKYENIYATVGIHPHEAKNEQNITIEELINFTKHAKVVGVGETGLDYYYEHSDRNIQKEVFVKHIKVAQDTGLPLIIHSRDADVDMMDILTQKMKEKKFKALLHCFSSGEKLAMQALDLGIYISFSGIITFNKSDELRKILKIIPQARILVETDSPYLAPVPYRGQSNQPAYVLKIVEKIAELLDEDVTFIKKVTTDNFFRLFSKLDKNMFIK